MGSFGETLRELRRAAGVTQRELAQRTDLDFSYISKLENDRNSPPAADRIVRISEVLGVSAEHLLALTGKIPSDVQHTIGTSLAAQEFLRETQRLNLTDEEWRSLSQEVRRLRGEFQ
jgi:HTH-type transcriptional regulator, competence development regulator